ncbi:MAG: hypothetical protein K2X66_09890 [Cyanobacteria bacterium]|nr:hypothetical protein [Cyanobacteriota bacterium]
MSSALPPPEMPDTHDTSPQNTKKKWVTIGIIVGLLLTGLSCVVISTVGIYYFGKVHEGTSSSEIPYDNVGPNTLKAQKYYDLGVQYKIAGWTEKSREALEESYQLDPDGQVGKRAKRYSQTRLPKYPVTPEAEQGNIQGFNQWQMGDIQGAEKTFKHLIEEYPRFEWPYGNLGALYIETNRPQAGKVLLDQALALNPLYLNGWLHRVELYKVLKDSKGERASLQTAIELDPENELLKEQLKTLQQKNTKESDKFNPAEVSPAPAPQTKKSDLPF